VCVTAASGGSLLFTLYRPFAILKPKNRKNCTSFPHAGVLKTTRHRGKFPEVRRHSAPVHAFSVSYTSPGPVQKIKAFFFFSPKSEII
jgi:hypothetical protein